MAPRPLREPVGPLHAPLARWLAARAGELAGLARAAAEALERGDTLAAEGPLGELEARSAGTGFALGVLAAAAGGDALRGRAERGGALHLCRLALAVRAAEGRGAVQLGGGGDALARDWRFVWCAANAVYGCAAGARAELAPGGGELALTGRDVERACDRAREIALAYGGVRVDAASGALRVVEVAP